MRQSSNEEGDYCCPGSLLWKTGETDKKNTPILAELLKAENELNEHVLHTI
jgi:hypothetical protein